MILVQLLSFITTNKLENFTTIQKLAKSLFSSTHIFVLSIICTLLLTEAYMKRSLDFF
jgi:hypothetical protein